MPYNLCPRRHLSDGDSFEMQTTNTPCNLLLEREWLQGGNQTVYLQPVKKSSWGVTVSLSLIS